MHQSSDGLPEAFLTRLESIVPAGDFSSVCEAFDIRRPTTFRTNTLKNSAAELQKKLEHLGFILEQVDWYADAFILKNRTQKELTDTDLYANGFFYVQSLSSMIPPLVLEPGEGEAIGDITAAPGSKTTQIAAMMHNSGKIVANDKSRVRNYRLAANLRTQGVTNTEVTNIAGQIFWQTYPEYFDRVLVDVPCSMEGRFCRLDPKTYEDWSTKKIKELVGIQRFLLRSAVSATRPGGIIVYSTCTLAPEENEGVVSWVLAREKGAVELADIPLAIAGSAPGLVRFGERDYGSGLVKAVRILPSALMEGFFVAKLVKTQSTIPLSARV